MLVGVFVFLFYFFFLFLVSVDCEFIPSILWYKVIILNLVQQMSGSTIQKNCVVNFFFRFVFLSFKPFIEMIAWRNTRATLANPNRLPRLFAPFSSHISHWIILFKFALSCVVVSQIYSLSHFFFLAKQRHLQLYVGYIAGRFISDAWDSTQILNVRVKLSTTQSFRRLNYCRVDLHTNQPAGRSFLLQGRRQSL